MHRKKIDKHHLNWNWWILSWYPFFICYLSLSNHNVVIGPEFVFKALSALPDFQRDNETYNLQFISNIDPINFSQVVSGLNCENTMVIVISKTFTTQETLLNYELVKNWMKKGFKSKASESAILSNHFFAITSNPSNPAEKGFNDQNIFKLWDWVGGRYSVCSAVGMVPLSCVFSFNCMIQFLKFLSNKKKLSRIIH